MKIVTVALLIVLMSVLTALGADSLVVYSAGPKPLSAGLAKTFEKRTSTRVQLFQSTSGKIMARYEAEKANPQVDVLISASWGHAITLDKAGELLTYTSPNAKMVPDSLKTENYVAQGAAALAIAYNPKTGMPAPVNWTDLTNPAYKGQITMPDPSKSGSALTLVQGLVSQNADQAWEMFAKLKENEMIVPGANRAALNPVLQGAKGVVFGAVDYIAIGAKAKGESLEVVYPADGTVLAPRPMMIVKTTRNARAAKAFIDFVLSQEGQQMVADLYILPARKDIKAKRPGWNELNIIEFDAVKAADEAPAIKRRYREIFR